MMHPEQKLSILLEGQKNGISDACRKHHISRTLYYRWLKRYKAEGIAGLDQIIKDFTPPNKTDPAISAILMALVKKNPSYGPRALKYMLDDLSYGISESAVYNILRKQRLSTRKQRVNHAKKRETSASRPLPRFSQLSSGECWLFWTTHVGSFHGIGALYIYTFLDLKSRIACSRLYTSLSAAHFENLLTAVAMPVAQTLKFDARHLYVSKEDGLCGKNGESFVAEIEKALLKSGFDASVYTSIDPLDEQEAQTVKNSYNHILLSALLTWIQEGLTLKEILIRFQHHIRTYNLQHKSLYGQELYTPVEYHAKAKHLELILPLWAYMDRDY